MDSQCLQIDCQFDCLPVCRVYWFALHYTINTDLVCTHQQTTIHPAELVIWTGMAAPLSAHGYCAVPRLAQGSKDTTCKKSTHLLWCPARLECIMVSCIFWL